MTSSSVPARTGKIARLPHAIRTELNRRLECNVPGPVLLEWLNNLPEVLPILRDYFNGDPINKQNLSNWRRGGFREWQTREAFFDGLRLIADDAADFASHLENITAYASRLAALHITRVLGPAESIRGTAREPVPRSPGDIKFICQLSHAAAALHRSETSAARLRHRQKHDAKSESRPSAPAPKTPEPEKPANTLAPPPVKPGQGKSSTQNLLTPLLLKFTPSSSPPLSLTDPAGPREYLPNFVMAASSLPN